MAVATGTALAIGMGLSAVGTAVTMYGQDTANKQLGANLKWQAAQAEADAKAEAGAAMVEAERIRKAAKAQRAKAVAAVAASGIDVDSPTAIRIDQDIIARAEEDALLTLMQGADRAARLRQQSHADRTGAGIARRAGRVSQAATLLSGASTAISYNDGWKRSRKVEG